MSSWLKVAEGLLEVVDRRAKLVVGELSDEQSDSQQSAPNGQESKVRRTNLNDKVQKRLSNEPSKTSDIAGELDSVQVPSYNDNASPDKDMAALSSEHAETMSNNSTGQTSRELQLDASDNTTITSTPLLETLPNNHDPGHMIEVPLTVSDVEVVASSVNGEHVEKTSDEPGGSSSDIFITTEVEDVNGDHPTDSVTGQGNITSEVEDFSLDVDQKVSESESLGTHSKSDNKVKDAVLKEEPLSDSKERREHRNDASSVRVQDQLDEAQGLLQSAVSTGPSKEARLARVCAGLSSRLQEYKSENSQLEELLIAERERSNSYKAYTKQLQQDLSVSKIEASKIESNMAEALSAKNLEIGALISSMDALKKQAAASEGKMASLQADMESIMRNRELTETRMMQALREELASVERRAEEEHVAHNATKMAAMEREVELEHRALEASTALARIQRTVDERTSRAAELEQKLALLEVECASLNQELQDMEARARREQMRSPEEANQALQVQAWQEEVERARQGQREAESKLSSLEAEMQKMRVEMAAMKRDAEHYSRQEHMELEKRYRELTDLLYYKQTQLEAMASEKAAAEFQLEKEAKRLHEAQIEAERTRASRRTSSWEEDTDLRTLEPLPLHHRHMAGASLQLQKAVKLLDSGAVRATRFLWRYPVARVILLFYLVFVHLFLMYLLHRLQEQADNFASREVAASMGLTYPNLP